jgi:hypothetical protein
MSTMRMFVGMIVGCLLTIAAVYIHDANVPQTAGSKAGSAVASQRIVNWDVASSEWNKLKDQIRLTWTKLTANIG